MVADPRFGHRDHGRQLAAQRLRALGDGQPLVQRSALVGLVVREGDPAKRFEREDAGHGGTGRGKQAPRARVEEQRLLVDDQELVEGEAPGHDFGGTGVLKRNKPSEISSILVCGCVSVMGTLLSPTCAGNDGRVTPKVTPQI